MLIKCKYKPENIYITEHKNGALLIRSLVGKYITVLDGTANGIDKEIERIDRLQGQRIKKLGHFY